jgi:hypothetical protein
MKQTLILSILATFVLNSAAFADPVTLVLKLKERTSMEELARSVTDPSSARFNKFYTKKLRRLLPRRMLNINLSLILLNNVVSPLFANPKLT